MPFMLQCSMSRASLLRGLAKAHCLQVAEFLMTRLIAVSFKPYRKHQLELRDAGRDCCAVIIHPPAGRGEPQEVSRQGQPVTLGELVAQAKAMIDVVMGPRPPAPQRSRYGSPREW
jgi:hypothetical protein